jgi:hypothetical protein
MEQPPSHCDNATRQLDQIQMPLRPKPVALSHIRISLLSITVRTFVLRRRLLSYYCSAPSVHLVRSLSMPKVSVSMTSLANVRRRRFEVGEKNAAGWTLSFWLLSAARDRRRNVNPASVQKKRRWCRAAAAADTAD